MINVEKRTKVLVLEEVIVTRQDSLGDLFLMMLAEKGGKIVSSNDLTVFQMAAARAEDRFFVNREGFGFAYLPPQYGIPVDLNSFPVIEIEVTSENILRIA